MGRTKRSTRSRVTKAALEMTLENARIANEADRKTLYDTRAAYDRTVNELSAERFACSELRREVRALRTRLDEIHEHAVNTILNISSVRPAVNEAAPTLRAVTNG